MRIIDYINVIGLVLGALAIAFALVNYRIVKANILKAAEIHVFFCS